MPGVSVEQIRAAREIDLLTYLQVNEPHELRRIGSGEYRTASHGSLVISNGMWFWNKGGFGGRNLLDYLIKVRGMAFVDAVQIILNNCVTPSFSALPVEQAKPQPRERLGDTLKKKLILPKSVRFSVNVAKYLERRGIHPDIIGQCLKAGVVYEATYKNPREPTLDGAAVCVFIGRDDNGIARFAALRGIHSDLKRDVSGSDKRFGFCCLPASEASNRSLAVFEAPLDLLSHMSLDCYGSLKFDGHRLSLGGTSEVSLMAFLERRPQIEAVSLCLDNDGAGQTASRKIRDKLASEFGHIAVTIDPPKLGKDYNDELVKFKEMRSMHSNRQRSVLRQEL